jgi:glycosyltransferase involved in cell wall biosynthesis
LKILFLHTHYQLRGGEDSVFQKEAELLSHSNEVEVIAFRNKSGCSGAIQYFISLWNVFAAEKIRKKIQSFKPDIIHIHNLHFEVGPIVIRTASKYGVSIVVTLHNYRLLCPSATLFHKNQIFTNSIRAPFPWMAIRRKIYRNSYLQTFWLAFIYWFHRKLGTWQMVDKYIVLTDFSKKLFLQSRLHIGSSKFIVKSNFVDEPLNRKLQRKDAFLFVGRLSEEKGIEVLLDAFSKSSLMLRIVGDGPLEKIVKNFATQHSNVLFLGRLNADDVRREMFQCNALVFPSVWFEGMPMTIIEAFATGTPVIASRLGAMESMIEDEFNGLHFKVGEAKELRKKLAEWNAMSEEEKKSYRIHARKTYETYYTPNGNLEQLQTLYKSVIDEKKGNQIKPETFFPSKATADT